MIEHILVYIYSFLELITVFCLIKLSNGSERLTMAFLPVFCGLGAAVVCSLDYLEAPYQLMWHMVLYVAFFRVFLKDKLYRIITDVLMANGVYFLWQIIISAVVSEGMNLTLDAPYVMFPLLIFSAGASMLAAHSVKLDRFMERHYRENRAALLWVVSNVIVVACIVGNSWDDERQFVWGNIEVFLLMLALYILSGSIVVASWIRTKKERSKNDTIMEYTEYLRNLVSLFNGREHEYKHQIQAVISIAESSPDADTRQKIVSYCMEIASHEKERKRLSIISDNTIISAFIIKTERIMKSMDVNFEYHIESPAPHYDISEFELLEAVSNLVNNAMEAVCELKKDKRNVSILFRKNRIEVLNDIPDGFEETDVMKFSSREYSTKGKGRGYGIPNVIDITKKNGIRFNIICRDQMVIASLEFKTSGE